MKTEQKEENSGLMESLSLRIIRGRDRDRDREKTITIFNKKYSISIHYSIHMCVQ